MKQYMARRNDFEVRALSQFKSLYQTASIVLDNEADAQRLVQESFIKANRLWHECKSGTNCRVWLFAILIDILVDKYRPFTRLSSAINSAEKIDGYLIYSKLAKEQQIEDSGHGLFSVISGDDVKKAIRYLPDDFKLVLALSILEGISYQEIAEIVGINLDAVRFKLRQSRKLMQRNLFDHISPIEDAGKASHNVKRATGGKSLDTICQPREIKINRQADSRQIHNSVATRSE
jgi:RNA polymerase sigma-70 factor (ECF subfamily)